MFIDTHAHLNDEKFEGETCEVIARAKKNAVDTIICSGTNLSTNAEAIEIAEKYDGVYATIGIHPQDCENLPEDYIERLENQAKSKKVIGIGEIGLEYMDSSPNKELQQEVFINQIELAYKLKLPIVIHCRNAIGDCIKILKENRDKLKYGGTFHCFSESVEIAKIVLELGLHISVGGVVTFKNGKRLQEVVPTVPLERILLETDCPYLAPEPVRGSRNEPSNIPYIARKIGDLKGISMQEVGEQTTQNARRLFEI